MNFEIITNGKYALLIPIDEVKYFAPNGLDTIVKYDK